MVTRKDSPLEEKLKIPVRKLPLSSKVKKELLNKSVYSLKQIYDKFLKLIDPKDGAMKVYLPGFTRDTYWEIRELITEIGLISGDYEYPVEKDKRICK